MTSAAITVEQYLAELPEERKLPMQQLRSVIKNNLPEGFSEAISSGMIGYAVPHSLYPPGYHCDPGAPLPFMSIASQKNFIAVYHMGIYASPTLLQWFIEAHANLGSGKLDMGKSCIRFKKMEKIPFELIGKLSSMMTVDEWINCYETNLQTSRS